MAGMTDSLRILITANGSAAEREFAKVGAASRRSLGMAENNAQRYSRTLTSAGVAMASFGAVALIGLGKAAQAAEEEHAALLRLETTIGNQPALVGASTDAFLDQAAALQDTTRFADDVTVSAQAMLGSFGLTQDQIMDLIPLVQDYAAITGTDLVTAARQVGRSVDGTNGTLKRAGVTFDEAAYSADHFAGTMEALKRRAGGFAAEEGQTLSGQLEILRNNFDDLVEGVGVGATEAFSDLAGGVKFLADAFDNLDPAAQSAIGQVLTWGAVGLTAVGATSFLVGQLLKLGPAFSFIGSVGPRAYAAIANLIVPTDALAVSMNGLAASETAAGTAGAGVVAPFLLLEAAIVATGAGLSVAIEKLGELAGFDWPSGLSTNVHQWNGEIDRAIAANPELVQALTTGKQGFDILNSGIAQATTNLDELTQEIQDYLDGVYDLPEAQRAVNDAFDNLFSTLLTQGHSVDDVAESMQGIVEATAGVISAGGDADVVARTSILRLREQYDAGLITIGSYRDQREAILNIPGVSRTLFQAPMLRENHAGAINYRAELDRVDRTNPTSYVTAHGLSSSLNDAIRYSAQLSNLDGRRVDSWVNIHTSGSAKLSAAGGPLGSGEMSVVGEKGPELFVPNTGGNILPAENTARLLMGMGRQGEGGGGTTIQVVVNGSATKADGQAVVDALQRWQRSNGRVPVKTMA